MSQRHRFGRCEVRPEERLLLIDGRPSAVGARAFDLLLALIERRDRLVTKDELLGVVWSGLVVSENNLHTQVSTLRSLLGSQAIATIPGRGYRFTMQVQSDSRPDDADAAAAPVPASDTSSVRKLVAILSADVAGYSRLMGEDDQATLEAIVATRHVAGRHIAGHGGRLVDAIGDALLAEFPSAIESVRCAVAIQSELAARNAALPERRRMVLRIGLNVGDVIEKDGALYGQGVNVAARLQALGEPGGVCVSGSIFDQVDGRSPMAFRFAGEQSVKNIARPVRTYHLVVDAAIAKEEPSPQAARSVVHRFGACEVRPDERLLRVGGEPAKLGARAFDVLLALIERRPGIVTKNELLDLVWPGVVVEENNLPTQISSLRKVLGPQVIETIPGRGYRFVAELQGEAPAVAVLAAAIPAPAAGAFSRHTNLPAAAEALFGRTADIDALEERLSEHRLVTVLGTGGVGKTSVAQALARRLVGSSVRSVWWVDLSAVGSPEGIPAAIANAVGLQLGRGDVRELLMQSLASRETTLVMDNCESLVGAVADIVDAALATAPGLRIIATSREPLRVADEQLYRLDVLAVPPADASVDEARQWSAVQLFERRAVAADRHFVLTASNVAAVIRLCRRLDGIPLALEMAAARLALLGLTALDARLGERLRLLKSHSQLAPPRQQTLQATLDWSHALLTADEKIVLRRLSVFVGAFRLDSARTVASCERLDEWDVVDALSGLVDKSLVQAEQPNAPAAEMRYRLLETTRLYAAQCLAEHGEVPPTERRHGRALAVLADAVERDYWVMADRPWLDRYAQDYDDLQTAFERACRTPDADVGAATLEALFKLDHVRANFAAMAPWLESAAVLLPVADPLAKARLHLHYLPGTMASVAVVDRNAAARQAVDAFRAAKDQRRLFQALLALSTERAMSGRFEEADDTLAEALSLMQPLWPARLRWLGADHRREVETYRGDAAAYRSVLREQLSLAAEAGSPCQVATARVNMADAALMAGEYDESVRLGRAAVAEVHALGLPEMEAVAMLNLCAALVQQGDVTAAREAAVEGLPLTWRHNLAGYLLCHLALLATSLARNDSAARMLGFAKAWAAAGRFEFQANELRAFERAKEAVAVHLDPAKLEALQHAGSAMSEMQAQSLVEETLGVGQPVPVAARAR